MSSPSNYQTTQNSPSSILSTQPIDQSIIPPDFQHQSLSSIPSTINPIPPSPSLLKIANEQQQHLNKSSNPYDNSTKGNYAYQKNLSYSHAAPVSLNPSSLESSGQSPLLSKFNSVATSKNGENTSDIATISLSAIDSRNQMGITLPKQCVPNNTPSRAVANLNAQIKNSSLQKQQQEQISSLKSDDRNFKVVIRIRPPLQRQIQKGVPFRSVLQLRPDHRACAVAEYIGAEIDQLERQKDIKRNQHSLIFHQFAFDYIYEPAHDQAFVYENTAKAAVLSTLKGYNATLLAYGQTGTGKTYTMQGYNTNSQKTSNDSTTQISISTKRGIIPRAMEQIFKYIEKCSDTHTTFMVRASYLQIYNQVVSDLLKPEKSGLQIRQDKKKGVFVQNLSEWAVRSPNQVFSLLQKGSSLRKTAATKMNIESSRSHAVFVITIQQMNRTNSLSPKEKGKHIKVGKLNLVDLAGSQRVKVSQATGARLEESKSINKSLSALGNVISALTEHVTGNNAKQSVTRHIPYRDSKLTRLLEDSLGGNCKTTMLAMISPAPYSISQTLSTLKFATRAKKVRNDAKVNEDVDDRALLKKYEMELKRLRQELEVKNHQMNTSVQVIQLEEEKKRAEKDKQNAILALKEHAMLYEKQKQQKQQLQEKIQLMNSQLLHGGQKIQDTPQFRSALEEKQRVIRQEYEDKLTELESERESIVQSRAQVDKYKNLLLKQRDIMVMMTSRLNERDDTILQLQEQLDVYDKVNKETNLIVQDSASRISELQSLLVSNGINLPPDRDRTLPVRSSLSSITNSTLSQNNQHDSTLIAGRVSLSSVPTMIAGKFNHSRQYSVADTVQCNIGDEAKTNNDPNNISLKSIKKINDIQKPQSEGPRQVDSNLIFGKGGILASSGSIASIERAPEMIDTDEATPEKMKQRNVLGMLESQAGGVLKNIMNQVIQRGEQWKGVADELQQAVKIVCKCADQLRSSGNQNTIPQTRPGSFIIHSNNNSGKKNNSAKQYYTSSSSTNSRQNSQPILQI